MPATVNGIGTSYFGRKNLEIESAVCEFCRRPTNLRHYQTTLWFTVVFLPVIPLGRKQILADCSLCRRHRVLPLRQWEALCSQTIAAAKADADAAPSDPIPSLRLLGILLGYFQRDAAIELAGDLLTRFPQHVDALMAAGVCLEKYGHATEAERAYWAALNADPASLVAKRAVAWRLVERGDPQSAEQLLAAAPRLTAEHDPALFAKLGRAFQAQGRSPEALAAFRAAVAAAPQLGRDRANRKAIAAAERAAGATETMLPKIALWRRWPWLLPAAGVAVAASLAIAANLYIAEHRTLHVVNGFATPLTIRFDDGREIQAPAQAMRTISISEGRRHATVIAGGRELGSEEFEVASGVWERFFRKPVFVFNPGGGAALLWEKVIYAAVPQPGAGEDRLCVGAVFFAFDDVDYPFQRFPQSLSIKRNESVTKTRLSLLPFDARKLLEAPEHLLGVDDRLGLAEAHLRVAPSDANLRELYSAVAAKSGAAERAGRFLASLGPL